MALSGSVAVKATSQNNLIFSWAAAQNITANRSVISWQLLLEAKQFGRIAATPGSGWSVTVAGREFSGTTSLAIENNQTKVLASGQVTLDHQADGSGSFSFAFSQQFYITFGGEYIQVVSGSGSAQLDTIPRASRPVAGDGVLGSPMTISLEGTGAGTHTLEYSFGKASGVIARDVTDSCSWTPPLSLAGQIPDTVSGTAIIKCTTYAGGVPVGSAQTAVKLTVPESAVPSLTASWEDPSGALETVGCLVQNVSRLAVTVSGTGIYGSGITGAQVTLDGKSYGGGCLTDSGERSLQAAVTDSRGRTAAKTYPITVVPYQAPWLTLSASRCLEDGTADDTGDYAKITVTGHVSELGGANSARLTLKWGAQQEEIPLAAGDIAYGVTVYADPNATLEIRAVLSDRLVAASRNMILSTGYATLDLLAGGKGIALGKAATREGFECAMPAYFSGGLYGIGADGTADSRSLFDRVAAQEFNTAEGVEKAVAAYLEDNALAPGATAEEAAQIARNQADIQTLLTDKARKDEVFDAARIPGFTNLFDTVAIEYGKLLNSDGTVADTSAALATTGFIPYRGGDILRMQNFALFAGGSCRIILYDENFAFAQYVPPTGVTENGYYIKGLETDGNGNPTAMQILRPSAGGYLRICTNTAVIGSDPILTVNEEITYSYGYGTKLNGKIRVDYSQILNAPQKNGWSILPYAHLNICYSGIHRKPINTAEHFADAAANFGYNALKCDVRPTADGELVCCHDGGFTFDADGCITAYDSANATAIHDVTAQECLGYAFPTGEHPCLVGSFLEICRSHGKVAFITIRNEYMDTVIPKLLKELKLHSMTCAAIINSMSYESLVQWRTQDQSVMLNYTLPAGADMDRTAIDRAVALGYCSLCGFGLTSAVLTPTHGCDFAYAADRGIRLLQAIAYKEGSPEACYAMGYDGCQIGIPWHPL